MTGCAGPAPSGEPLLDQHSALPIDRPWSAYRLQQDHIFSGQLVAGQNPPPDGTVEFVFAHAQTSGGWGRLSCSENNPLCMAGFVVLYPVMAAAIVVTAPIVIPTLYILETQGSSDKQTSHSAAEPSAAKATQDSKELAAGATDYSRVVTHAEKGSLRERELQSIASLVLEERFSSDWNAVYVLELKQALGWGALSSESPKRFVPPTEKDPVLRSGISQLVLLESTQGEKILVLCARSLIDDGNLITRYFETCRSENLGSDTLLPISGDSEKGRAVLIGHAKKLAALHAYALTGRSPVIRVLQPR